MAFYLKKFLKRNLRRAFDISFGALNNLFFGVGIKRVSFSDVIDFLKIEAKHGSLPIFQEISTKKEKLLAVLSACNYIVYCGEHAIDAYLNRNNFTNMIWHLMLCLFFSTGLLIYLILRSKRDAVKKLLNWCDHQEQDRRLKVCAFLNWSDRSQAKVRTSWVFSRAWLVLTHWIHRGSFLFGSIACSLFIGEYFSLQSIPSWLEDRMNLLTYTVFMTHQLVGYFLWLTYWNLIYLTFINAAYFLHFHFETIVALLQELGARVSIQERSLDNQLLGLIVDLQVEGKRMKGVLTELMSTFFLMNQGMISMIAFVIWVMINSGGSMEANIIILLTTIGELTFFTVYYVCEVLQEQVNVGI